jgi:hypothetical protein
VEYAPDLDREQRTAKLVLDLLSSALAPAARAMPTSSAAA